MSGDLIKLEALHAIQGGGESIEPGATFWRPPSEAAELIERGAAREWRPGGKYPHREGYLWVRLRVRFHLVGSMIRGEPGDVVSVPEETAIDLVGRNSAEFIHPIDKRLKV